MVPTHPTSDPLPSADLASTDPLTRRRFLTYVVAAPVLTVAATSAGALLAPGTAYAVVPSPPQPENLLDLGDVMVAATKQAQDLLVLEVTTDNRVVFHLPRAEVGQGVTTALALVVADEIDARLTDVDVPLEDARQDLGTAQSTGGSSSIRSLWDPVRSIAAEARARLDELLAEVESDAGDVDQLAAKVREAAELIRFCRDRRRCTRVIARDHHCANTHGAKSIEAVLDAAFHHIL